MTEKVLSYFYRHAVYNSPEQLAKFLGAEIETSGLNWFTATGFIKREYARKFYELLKENGHKTTPPYTRQGTCSSGTYHVVRFQ